MTKHLVSFTGAAILGLLLLANTAQADTLYSQTITLAPGWNIVSTPRVLDSHAFSAPETSDNFDIYVLDPSQPSGWATMAAEGQTEFTPLYGYFIDNKTGADQTLTFNYEDNSDPSTRLFQRTFQTTGWYSIGVANPTYAVPATATTSADTNNPSNILSALSGSYETAVDFTDGDFSTDQNSVAVSDSWKAATAADVNSLNDLRETKGYAVYVTQADALYDGFQNNDIPQTSTTIVTPNTITNAASVGSQNLAVNVPNQPLGGFETDFTDEAVSVTGLEFNVATSSGNGTPDLLTNVTLVDQNGNVVAGPVNETSNGTITFSSSVTFPVGVMTYTLKGTVPLTAANGETYTLTTDPATDWFGATGVSSGDSFTFSDSTVTMSTMTVQGGTLTISAASTPAASTIAPGSNNLVIANISLDASQSGEDVRLTALPIVVDATSTADASNLKTDLTNCQLYNGSTALNSQAIGTSQWSVNPTGVTGLEANFVFQNALTVPKGTIVTLALECNVSASIYNGEQFSAGVNSSYAPSVTGTASGDTITPTVQTSSSGTMTAGTATLAVSVPSPISYTQVSGGTTGVTVGTFTLEPSNDSVSLQNVGLALNSNYASSSDISRAYIYDGSTQIGSVIFTGSPTNGYYYATSTVSSVALPQNTQTTLTIKADVNQIGAGQAGTSGHEIFINLADAKGVGESSGTTVNSGPNSTTQGGVAMFRSYPMIAVSNFLPSNGIADGRLIAFTVTANSNNSLALYQLTFTVSANSATVSSPQLYAYTDSGFSTPASGTSGGIVSSTVQSGNTVTTTMSTPLEVPAGTTEYFLLKGTVSSSNSTYNVATTLDGDSSNLAPNMSTASGLSTSNFVWSPNSTGTSVTTASDWTNGYGVSGLPSIGITQNRTQ